MVKPRCPDPEHLALFLEDRLGRLSRGRVLRHAADCASCRRQLAIASLNPAGPLQATVVAALDSGKLTLCAGVLLGLLVLHFLGSGSEPAPTPMPRPARVATARAPSAPHARPPSATLREDDHAPRRSAAVVAPEPSAPREDAVAIGPVTNDAEPIPAPASDPAPTATPRRLDSVVAAPTPATPPPTPRPVEVETMGRLAILDPFGSLALEGAGGRLAVQSSRVVPVEARITALTRTSGFRLGDGIRVQLAPGSSVSVFQNLTRRCAGLAVLQGALLVESAQPQSLFLRREGASGLLESWSGPVLVNTGSRGDAMTVTPAGAGGVVWRKSGEAPLEIPAGETLSIDAAAQEVAARGSKARPSLSRFVNWPEPTSLFYSSFEDDVQGIERPTVVQGAAKEGYIAAVAGGRGRKTIELTLPASLQGVPPDAVLRLRVRTTATRIQFGVGSNATHTAPIIVAQRNRSETAWTAVTLNLGALDQDGHRPRGGGRQGLRGNLTFVAEAPSRLAAEDLVFDIDEIEISRS